MRNSPFGACGIFKPPCQVPVKLCANSPLAEPASAAKKQISLLIKNLLLVRQRYFIVAVAGPQFHRSLLKRPVGNWYSVAEFQTATRPKIVSFVFTKDME